MNDTNFNLAKLIRSDCTVVCPNGKILTAEKIHTLKNFYKKKIYEKLNGETVGKTAIIWSNNLDVVIPAITALWELGAAISIYDYDQELIDHPTFKNFYTHIDLIIGPPSVDHCFIDKPHLPALETILSETSWVLEKLDVEPEWIPTVDEFPDVEYTLNKPITKDTLAVVTHANGSTGDVNMIEISHFQAYQTVIDAIALYDFSENDCVMHFKTFWHGSLFLHHGVPGLASTKNHVWFMQQSKKSPTELVQDIVKLCKQYQITKVLLPYDWTNLLSECIGDLSNTSVHTIFSPTPEFMKQIFEKVNPKKIYNSFGSTGVGTVAISETDKNNLENYNPQKFDILNKSVDIKINKYSFDCKHATDIYWRTVNDRIEIVNDALFYKGRNSIIVMDDQEIDITELENFLKNYLPYNQYILVPDFKLNCFYLAFSTNRQPEIKSLDEINTEIRNHFNKSASIKKLNKVVFSSQGMRNSIPLLIWLFQNQKVDDALYLK
jgi:hypothetical protein